MSLALSQQTRSQVTDLPKADKKHPWRHSPTAIPAHSVIQRKAGQCACGGDSPATERAGLPALGYSGGLDDDTKIGVGESRNLTLIAHSIAGAGTGVRVIVWGSALDDELITVSGASLTIGEGNPPRATDLANQSGSNEIILTALAEDFEIPAGYGSPGEAFAAADGDTIKGMSLWMATRIEVGLNIVAVRPGTGVLSAALQPLANIEEGHAVWTTDVQVDA